MKRLREAQRREHHSERYWDGYTRALEHVLEMENE
jgi:hypothetical protein